jgi:hypothetical protein
MSRESVPLWLQRAESDFKTALDETKRAIRLAKSVKDLILAELKTAK